MYTLTTKDKQELLDQKSVSLYGTIQYVTREDVSVVSDAIDWLTEDTLITLMSYGTVCVEWECYGDYTYARTLYIETNEKFHTEPMGLMLLIFDLNLREFTEIKKDTIRLYSK